MWDSVIFRLRVPNALPGLIRAPIWRWRCWPRPPSRALQRVRIEGLRIVAASDPQVDPHHGRRRVGEGILWHAQAVDHQVGGGLTVQRGGGGVQPESLAQEVEQAWNSLNDGRARAEGLSSGAAPPAPLETRMVWSLLCRRFPRRGHPARSLWPGSIGRRRSRNLRVCLKDAIVGIGEVVSSPGTVGINDTHNMMQVDAKDADTTTSRAAQDKIRVQSLTPVLPPPSAVMVWLKTTWTSRASSSRTGSKPAVVGRAEELPPAPPPNPFRCGAVLVGVTWSDRRGIHDVSVHFYQTSPARSAKSDQGRSSAADYFIRFLVSLRIMDFRQILLLSLDRQAANGPQHGGLRC